MLRDEYDEEAAARWLDLARADEDRDSSAAWLDVRRLLGGIEDPLVRRLVALHRHCDPGCATLQVIARHYAIDVPPH